MYTQFLIHILRFVIVYRLWFLGFFFSAAVLSLFYLKPIYSDHDTMMWEHASQKSSLPQNLDSFYKVTISTNTLSPESLEKIIAFRKHLYQTNHITEEYSIFTIPIGVTKHGDVAGSSWLTLSTLHEVSIDQIPELLHIHHQSFSPYITPQNNTISLYLGLHPSSTLVIPKNDLITSVERPFSYEVSSVNWLIFIALMSTFALLMKLYFKSWSVPLALFVPTLFLSLMTLALASQFFELPYLTLPLMVIGLILGFGNFFLVYYRWHVFQHLLSSEKSLRYTLINTLVPYIFSTLLLLVAGTSAVVFTQSIELTPFIYLIGTVQLLNLFFLLFFVPAFLSFFPQQRSTPIAFTISHILTSQKNKWGKFIIYITLFSAIILTSGTLIRSLSDHQSTSIIHVGIQYPINAKSLQQLSSITNKLESLEDVDHVVSILDYLHFISPQKNRPYRYDQANISGALFYLDLFGLRESYFVDDIPIFQIYLQDNANRDVIYQSLKDMIPSDQLQIYDSATYLDHSNFESYKWILSIAILLLVLIAVAVSWWGKNKKLLYINALINLLPLITFVLLIYTLRIPISGEILIAIVLSIVLASDLEIYAFYNLYADGKYSHDDVVQRSWEQQHLANSTLLNRLGVISILLIIAACSSGSVLLITMYLGTILMLSLLSDWFFVEHYV